MFGDKSDYINNVSFEQRKADLNQLYNEISNTVEANNLVPVLICLPCNFIVKLDHNIPIPSHLLYGSSNTTFYMNFFIYIDNFFAKYEKENRYLNADKYGLEFPICISGKNVQKIMESNEIKNYLADNQKNNMMVTNYKEGYAIVSPEKIVKLNVNYSNNEIIIDKAPIIIWIRKDDIVDTLKNYNKLINDKKEEIIQHGKNVRKERLLWDLKCLFRRIWPFILGGIVILFLLILCR